MDLDGAAVVVTGAARGLGRKDAEAFASRGARVALVDLLEQELESTASEMKGAGHAVLPVVADVTEPYQVDAVARRVEEELGPVDCLVNNAGTFSHIGPLWEADPDRWFRDTRTSLFGSFLCCRAFVPGMVERKRGYVINTVSSGGVGDPHAHSTSYACAKTALMRMTEGLAKELEPHGVKVFAVAPPAVLTDMTRFIMEDAGGKKWRPGFKDIFEKGRASPPEAVAELVVGLTSGKADRLTGRYFLVSPPLDEVVARTEEILEKDLLTLRITRLP
jgi:NAD(P)-dependent dehydrogenase (short-subunit alcohol dehydrogenase family)